MGINATGYETAARVAAGKAIAVGGAGANIVGGAGAALGPAAAPASQRQSSDAGLKAYQEAVDQNGNVNQDKIKAGGASVGQARARVVEGYAGEFYTGTRNVSTAELSKAVDTLYADKAAGNPAATFALVASRYKNAGGNYNNGAIKELLEQSGNEDLITDGVGDKDVQTLAAVTAGLKRGTLQLGQIFGDGANDAIVEDDGKYQRAIDAVQAGNLSSNIENDNNDAGNAGDAGNSGNSGNAGNDTGNAGNDTGNAGNDTGNAGNDGAPGMLELIRSMLAQSGLGQDLIAQIMAMLEQMLAGADEEVGNAGDDTGNAGDDTGNAGNDTGNAGNDTGNAGDDTGNAGDDTGNAGNDTGNAGNDTGNAGNDTGNAGNDGAGEGAAPAISAAAMEQPTAAPAGGGGY